MDKTGVKMVCFDIGGVLARINRSWQGAAETAKVAIALPQSPEVLLSDLVCFEDFQGGSISTREYAASLALALGVSQEQAMEIHRGILIEPYPGTGELVVALQANGLRTGCLSNTNASHWAILRSPDFYPAIAALEVDVASHQLKLQKPDPAIYRHFESAYELKPQEIVFFDDVEANVESAKSCGWQAFRIDPEGDTAAQMLAAFAHLGVATAFTG